MRSLSISTTDHLCTTFYGDEENFHINEDVLTEDLTSAPEGHSKIVNALQIAEQRVRTVIDMDSNGELHHPAMDLLENIKNLMDKNSDLVKRVKYLSTEADRYRKESLLMREVINKKKES